MPGVVLGSTWVLGVGPGGVLPASDVGQRPHSGRAEQWDSSEKSPLWPLWKCDVLSPPP
jgi:hypothetical protein